MKKRTQDLQNRSLLLAILFVFGYVILAFLTTIPFNEISSNDNAYAGTQESVDTTATPSSFLDGTDESIDTTATPRATRTPIARATATPSATLAVFATPTSTPFDFFSDIASPTPETTIPPFDLNLPEEQGTIATPIPTATPAAVVAGSNNQLVIIGGIVGAVILVLIIVGTILMRRSKDNTPPMMSPQAPGNDLPPTPPNGPQYPPYINQQ